MNSDERIQTYYNQLFDLVNKRMHKVSIYKKIRAYGYHFLFMLGIAHKLDKVRAENYGKVLERGLRWKQCGQSSG
jgi:hypothetical protein